MSNRPTETPLSKPERVGRKSGFQLFQATWPDGNQNYFARVGLYFENKDTGDTYIIPKVYLGGVSEHLRALQVAEQKLEAIETSRTVKKEAKVELELVTSESEAA